MSSAGSEDLHLPPPRMPRVQGQNATEFTHHYVKDLILDLEIAPDAVITEKQVIAAIGLSRTPVREAFLRLQEERLVTLVPRGGAKVARITARQVRELAETRLLLENYAAEQICQHRIPTQTKLMALIERQETLVAIPDLIRVDRAFHAALVAAIGNTVMSSVYESLGDHQQRNGVLAFTLEPVRRSTATQHHRAIADALSEFDLSAAKRAIAEHLTISEQGYQRLLPH